MEVSDSTVKKRFNSSKMEYFDEKFSKNKASYISQCILATMAIFVILLFLDIESNAVLISALGASSFIAFTMPHAQVSKPRFLIGGYFVGTLSGLGCQLIEHYRILVNISFLHNNIHIVMAALAVGLAIFIMVITNTEHPPAAGLAFGMAIQDISFQTISIVLIGIIALSVVKAVLKPSLQNLL
ncbi:HPP family protein [bacterium]|nr:HPP family protein [bacterium]